MCLYPYSNPTVIILISSFLYSIDIISCSFAVVNRFWKNIL
nr:MAG TPA_asm: hypothetical protein [Caudoviricetes sp.]